MKKRVLLVALILILVITSLTVFVCCKENTQPIDDNGSTVPDNTDTSTNEYAIYVNDQVTSKQLLQSNGENEYFIKLTLTVGDHVQIKDSDDNIYNNYSPETFDGSIKISGEYEFVLKLDDNSHTIIVTIPKEDKPNPDKPTEYAVYVTSNQVTTNILLQSSGKNEYSIKLTLTIGDRVQIKDGDGKEYDNYSPETFDGTIKIAGDYEFVLKLEPNSHTISVAIPKDDTPDDNVKPVIDTVVDVYYTNSDNWQNVYAYMWNSKTTVQKKAWPGEKLTSTSVSGFGEKQYKCTVDSAEYDRIIFNNGSGDQTLDLTVNPAVSGYYKKNEELGVFTMNTDNYGKVEYFTLNDQKNLSYNSTHSKKFSVYTPSDYNPKKKYAVLYMFDSQNLYIGANGAEQSHDSFGSWSVDVAVTSLVKNGNAGVIIVAIDNTDGYRDQELTMSQAFGSLSGLDDTPAFKNGKLDDLGSFIVETLMPWVNSHYSVYGTRERTGIIGSSSGGLAAYYLGLKYNDIFGYIGAFSPANALFTTKAWNDFYSRKDFTYRPKIYVYCGQGDQGLEDQLLAGAKEITNLLKYGYQRDEISEYYMTGAQHNEKYWKLVFSEFLYFFVK